MHEFKIIQDIFPLIEKVAKENHLSLINKVTLSVGKLRQIQSEFLKFAFSVAAKNTLANGAELVINLIPITFFCQNCKKQFAVQENVYICPKCNGVSLEILTGKEIILESVDGEINGLDPPNSI